MWNEVCSHVCGRSCHIFFKLLFCEGLCATDKCDWSQTTPDCSILLMHRKKRGPSSGCCGTTYMPTPTIGLGTYLYLACSIIMSSWTSLKKSHQPNSHVKGPCLSKPLHSLDLLLTLLNVSAPKHYNVCEKHLVGGWPDECWTNAHALVNFAKSAHSGTVM